ncbi:MAG: HlyD family efflux transporter periplasmic adaptor subunit [Fuerstiella sp.]
MKKATSILIPIAIVAMGVAGMTYFGQPPEVSKDDKPQEIQAVLVDVDVVTEWNDPINVIADGEATTYKIVTLSTEVAGRIKSKPDESRGGMFVREGQTLFEIDPTNYRLQAERLEVQLAECAQEIESTSIDITNTSAMIKLAKEDLALQNKQLDRLVALQVRRTANDREVEEAMKLQLNSRNALQTLENQKRSFEQKVKTQVAGAKVTQSELDRANEDLKRCVVKSPLTGRLVDDIVETGDYVGIGDDLAHISDSSRMEIRTKLRGEQLAWIWLQHQIKKNPLSSAEEPEKSGDPLNLPAVACEVAYEFEGVETIWDGYIARLEGSGIDRDTRTFPCRVLVEEPSKTRVREGDEGKLAVRPPGLLSGMYVTVRIPVESPTRLLRVPLEAVRPGGQIWVKRENQLAIIKADPAYTFENHALLRAAECDLQLGDQVIISPLASVTSDLRVMTREERQAALDKAARTKPASPNTSAAKAKKSSDVAESDTTSKETAK